MNWFVVAVIILQLCAAAKYAIDRLYLDAIIWIGYVVINVVLLIKARD